MFFYSKLKLVSLQWMEGRKSVADCLTSKKITVYSGF